MKIKMVIILIAVFFLQISCQTGPVVVDDSYPDEELVTVRFVSMEINSYNLIAVSKFTWAKIPAGEAKLGGTVMIQHAGVSWKVNDAEFTCYLEKGAEYMIIGKGENMLWGVSVYKASNYREMTEENKVAFIPFKEQPKFN